MEAGAPRFAVATAKAPASPVPPTFSVPSRDGVVASATISGPPGCDAANRRVFTLAIVGAGGPLLQAKLIVTMVLGIGAEGDNVNTKLCAAPTGRFTGVFAVPTSPFVAGSVV